MLEDVPVCIRGLLRKMLHASSSKRPTMRDVLEELMKIKSELDTRTSPAPVESPLTRAPRSLGGVGWFSSVLRSFSGSGQGRIRKEKMK